MTSSAVAPASVPPGPTRVLKTMLGTVPPAAPAAAPAAAAPAAPPPPGADEPAIGRSSIRCCWGTRLEEASARSAASSLEGPIGIAMRWKRLWEEASRSDGAEGTPGSCLACEPVHEMGNRALMQDFWR